MNENDLVKYLDKLHTFLTLSLLIINQCGVKLYFVSRCSTNCSAVLFVLSNYICIHNSFTQIEKNWLNFLSKYKKLQFMTMQSKAIFNCLNTNTKIDTNQSKFFLFLFQTSMLRIKSLELWWKRTIF